jgi:hypothetical protein
MNEKREHIGLATCEYVDEDRGLSVWWVSRFGETGLTLIEGFEQFLCKPIGSPANDEPYSRIIFYQDGHEFLGFDEEATRGQLDEDFLYQFKPNPWDKEAKRILDIYESNISQELLEILFHKMIFKQKNNSILELPKHRAWTMTAILADNWMFALMSNKWDVGNPEWITFDNDNYEEFRARLDEFELIASTQGHVFIQKDRFLRFVKEVEEAK